MVYTSTPSTHTCVPAFRRAAICGYASYRTTNERQYHTRGTLRQYMCRFGATQSPETRILAYFLLPRPSISSAVSVSQLLCFAGDGVIPWRLRHVESEPDADVVVRRGLAAPLGKFVRLPFSSSEHVSIRQGSQSLVTASDVISSSQSYLYERHTHRQGLGAIGMKPWGSLNGLLKSSQPTLHLLLCSKLARGVSKSFCSSFQGGSDCPVARVRG